METYDIKQDEIDSLYVKLNNEAVKGGYNLNPEIEMTKDLVRSLLVNERRYGYWSCPCRLADGVKEKDLDIVCPCDYRDPDLNEWGACYCGLYVSDEVVEGKKKLTMIPERRPAEEARNKKEAAIAPPDASTLPYPVWRCKVCGYLCARDAAPLVCPVCRAKQERFERFL